MRSSISERIDRIEIDENIANTFRSEMNSFTSKYEDYSLYLSGGVDSTTILFSLLDNGFKPTCYTFHLSGEVTKDNIVAKKLCSDNGLKLIDIEIEKSEDSFVDTIKYLATEFDTYRKTRIQCLYPFKFMIEKLKSDGIDNMLIGFAGDDIAGKNRWHRFDYKEDQPGMIELSKRDRWNSFNDQTGADSFIYDLHKRNNINLEDPFFLNKKLANFVIDLKWSIINKPYAKGLYIKSYSEYWNKSNIFPISESLQTVGGIKSWHETFLKSKYNRKDYKDVKKIYEEICKSESKMRKFLEC